eukprot:TRINITY_DN1877_c0_g1_i3.p2 TRINITY_DN1877_c0_g1~~TRINITY_DN1877_c0_g1_i3.p2  ORF type:complete len:212 (+),score=44.94 TRINITY_DN1877_c0_g1_i3:427-1062(+)
MAQDNNCDYFFKLLLLGDSGVGKSSLITRFVENSFIEVHNYSIGLDFKIKTIDVNGKSVRLQVWDTAGQERFRTITSSYYRGSRGIIVVYAVDDVASFEHIKDWLDEIFRYLREDEIEVLIVANKCDLHDRKVDTKIARAYAEERHLNFYETSAKSAANVDRVFQDLTMKILSKKRDDDLNILPAGSYSSKSVIEFRSQIEEEDESSNCKC